MTVGQSKTIELSPAQAYGERDENAVLSFPASSAPDGLKVGDEVKLSSGKVSDMKPGVSGPPYAQVICLV